MNLLRESMRLAVLGIGFALVGCGQPATVAEATPEPRAAAADWKPEKMDEPTLPNAYRLHDKVISGGQPAGEPAFARLKELGVKTVISVDGATPEVALAKKHGLRYVHLPHSYDGVPEQRAKELAKAVRDLPGPVYIHCHHGKHRSPAAATVACVGAGLLSHDNALAVLKTAGTSQNYRGLYQSADSAKKLDSALLDELKVEYPETAKIPPIADAMIEMEHAHDHLKALAANKWQLLKDQPALEPAHEALLLREHYTELARTEEVQKQSEGFRELLTQSEASALELETLLSDWTKTGSPEPVPEAIGKAFTAVTQSCATCHKAHRDIPLGEKSAR
jgi:protein tyrosine phosphatase (PTP) superfamily phosphohydrolase (DUF442 family)